MQTRLPVSTTLAKYAGGAALGAVVSAVLVAGNPEALLKSGFETALKRSAANSGLQASRAPIAGSEEFWLGAIPAGNAAPISKTVSIGDRIAMTLGGVERKLEVAAVSEFEPKATEIDTRTNAVRLVLVTARDTLNPQARPIRFVVELETPAGTAGQTAQAKTL